MRWGAKDEGTDKGGLLQLHESMRESAERVPQLMKMIDKGKELIEMMSSEQTKEKVLEAAATVSATGVEARQCASYFVETMTREEEDAPRVHEAPAARVEDAGIEELDERLQQIWREKQEQDILRQNMKWGEEDQVVKKTGINPALLRPEMTILDRTTIDKVHEMRAANRKHLERSMKPEEIQKHIKFHRSVPHSFDFSRPPHSLFSLLISVAHLFPSSLLVAGCLVGFGRFPRHVQDFSTLLRN